MHLAIPHKMTQAAAAAKVKNALDENRAQIAHYAAITKEEWQGSTLNFTVDLQGKEISGTLEVTEADYVLDAKLPLMWRMFEDRIESEIAKRVQSLE